MAFIRDIKQNTQDSHQTSPGYVLTFIRWAIRNTKDSIVPNFLETRKPLVVQSDATQITVTYSKESHMPTAQIVLAPGEINYATAIHPGDFLFINLLNWDEDTERVRKSIENNLQPINSYNDGFKGVFKVQSVRKILKMNGDKKILMFVVTAAGFTEFNNVRYYNPVIASAFKGDSKVLYESEIGEFYANKLKVNTEVHDIVTDLFPILVGKSIRSTNVKIPTSGNRSFKIPSEVGRLLGRNAKYANELNNYIIGGWGSAVSGSELNLGLGFNPGIRPSLDSNVFNGRYKLQGNKVVYMETWNEQTAWSIIKANINELINEMYTCYRVGLDGNVYPTVIVRQKPFNTSKFKSSHPYTKFMDIPRWRISPNLITEIDTATSDAVRFNFVQIFSDIKFASQELQIAKKNYIYDPEDIEKHGLKPYIKTANFNFNNQNIANKAINIDRSRQWAELVYDWVVNGQLKEAGKITCAGIQEPICVGDNLELDGVVYHIEDITHSMFISMEGTKIFRTSIGISHGVDARTDSSATVYPESEFVNMEDKSNDDYNNERLLPGLSDTQNINGRSDGEITSRSKRITENIKEPIKRKRSKPQGKTNGEEDKPSRDS